MNAWTRVIFYAHGATAAYGIVCALYDGAPRGRIPSVFDIGPEAWGCLVATVVLFPLVAALSIERIPLKHRPRLLVAHALISLAQVAGLVRFIS